MLICGSYMFGFTVNKDMKRKNNNDKKRTCTYLLAYLLTLLSKNWKLVLNGGKNIKYNQTLNTLFSVFMFFGKNMM